MPEPHTNTEFRGDLSARNTGQIIRVERFVEAGAQTIGGVLETTEPRSGHPCGIYRAWWPHNRRSGLVCAKAGSPALIP